MKLFHFYYNSFKGLRKEVWYLALITLINRAGTMVIPFLSLYLTSDLGYSLKDVGWIMTSFGLGSVLGAWIGGKLSDKIGFYTIMFGSLVGSGVLFILLQFLESFYTICAGVFVVIMVADIFRPAVFVALRTYSKPENRTRSVTLIRLAINLGFSVGPAVGGLIIATMGYSGLFWVDGITCILSGFLFLMLLKKKEAIKEEKEENFVALSPYKDRQYLIAIFAIILIGFAFLQYFSTIPLYYKNYHHLSEEHIGWLMGLNGLLIFIVEMPFVKYFEQPKFSIYNVLFWSTLLLAASFLVLNLFSWVGMLVIGMLFMSVGEILNFPFLNSYALKRSERGNSGAYMGLFTMAFSVSHILGHNSGLRLIDAFGYEFTWYFMTGILVLASLLFLYLKKINA